MPAERPVASGGLLSNSMLLVGATGISSVSGFFFWFVAARTCPSDIVGSAASLVAAANLLAILAELGLGSVIQYFSRKGVALVPLANNATAVAWLSGWGISLMWLMFSGTIGSLIEQGQSRLIVQFVFGFYVVSGVLFAYQDAILLVVGRAEFIVVRAILCGPPSPIILSMLHGTSWNPDFLFLTFAMPNLMALAIMSIVLIPAIAPGYLALGHIDLSMWHGVWDYAVGSYVSGIIWGAMSSVVPVLATGLISSAQMARFFVAWSIMSGLYIIPRSVTAALFTETAAQPDKLYRSAISSSLAILGILVPSSTALWLWGPGLLSLFGKDFVNNEQWVYLLVSIVPFSINSILYSAFRSAKRLIELGSLSIAALLSVVAFANILAPIYGDSGVALAWLTAQTVTAILVTVGIVGASCVTKLRSVYSKLT